MIPKIMVAVLLAMLMACSAKHEPCTAGTYYAAVAVDPGPVGSILVGMPECRLGWAWRDPNATAYRCATGVPYGLTKEQGKIGGDIPPISSAEPEYGPELNSPAPQPYTASDPPEWQWANLALQRYCFGYDSQKAGRPFAWTSCLAMPDDVAQNVLFEHPSARKHASLLGKPPTGYDTPYGDGCNWCNSKTNECTAMACLTRRYAP